MVLSRKIADWISNSWMFVSIIIVLLLPLIIGVALYLKSAPLFEENSLRELLSSSEWSPFKGKFGFRPFIVSSFYVSLLAFLFAAPVCVLAGIYLTQFSSERLVRLMQPVIDILAGLPSVIYGVWGVLTVVPVIHFFLAKINFGPASGYNLLTGGIVLAVMCIPYMLNMIIEIFKTVPTGLKEAVLSLGANNWEVVKHVVLRTSLPGIFSAFGLGIAKALGETMAVLMVVGNSFKLPQHPLQPGYPLPALIANNYGEMLSIRKYDSALMFAALLLFGAILIINLLFRIIIFKTTTR